MSKKRHQHIIPECYLKEWCDPLTPPGHEPYIWIISPDGSNKKRKSPRKSFTETDFYTVKLADGSRNLVIEDSLSVIEDRFTRLRREAISRERQLDLDPRGVLCVFTAMMSVRTMPERRSLTKSFTELHEMTESLERQFQPGGQRVASLETERWKDQGHQFTIGHSIDFVSGELFEMHLCFLVAAHQQRFITSDHPCVWFNPEAYKWPPMLRGPGLAQKDIEITLPISPTHLAYFSWKRLPVLVKRDGKERAEGCDYLQISDRFVGELNRRTRAFCDTCIISQTAETQARWFENVEPPKDSWDKQHRSRTKHD
ncbi:MAG TPA: DUF4238 domain-containing protein [Candidatus Udaeobacter sp.]|jgi:hypothetical protein